jgi:hypothetical protein
VGIIAPTPGRSIVSLNTSQRSGVNPLIAIAAQSDNNAWIGELHGLHCAGRRLLNLQRQFDLLVLNLGLVTRERNAIAAGILLSQADQQ